MARSIILAALACALLAGGPAQAQRQSGEGRIAWRLENPFRLFQDPRDTEIHRQAYQSLDGAERGLPILAAERRLEALFRGRGWAEGVVGRTCYNADGDRFDFCPDYIQPKSHRIIASLVRQARSWDFRTSGARAEENCTWRLTDAVGERLAEERAPCNRPVALDIPYPHGGRLSVATGSWMAARPIEVEIRDVLIVGLGDSFGSGDGNPDNPVTFDDARSYDYGAVEIADTGEKVSLAGYPARQGDWRSLESHGFQRERAGWVDRECHRSLYSHQLRAALQLAVENPQRAITFVGIACSGAEIPSGLLLPKNVRECTPGDHFASPAQLSQLSEELCTAVKRGQQMPAAIINRIPELRQLSEDEMRITRCAVEEGDTNAGLKRPIDLVFLSIGGNDIGFTAMVSDSILRERSIYRALGAPINAIYGAEVARRRAELVQQRFEGLRFALELFFHVRSDRGGQAPVLLTGYPKMGYGADGVAACGGEKGMEVFPPFQLDAVKVGEAELFSEELNARLSAVAGKSWAFVDGFRADFRRHGLCAAGGDGISENLSFPRRVDGVWHPFTPSEYQPYTPRQRWFRTPNDAFLAVNMHADHISNFGANCSRLYTDAFKLLARRHWKPFQLFLASTYGGAFHPTAEGQARIADEVAAAARNILDRGD